MLISEIKQAAELVLFTHERNRFKHELYLSVVNMAFKDDRKQDDIIKMYKHLLEGFDDSNRH